MKTRRNFIKTSLSMVACLSLFGTVRWVMAKAGKNILPKGTKRDSLIDKDPARLDTRHLELTDLKDFETMGLTDFKTDLNTWTLRVDGEVEAPLELPYSQVMSFPSIERKVLLICPGFFANHGLWKGISIKELLIMAGSAKGVTHVSVAGPEGIDGKAARFPIADILKDKVFLVHTVNGVSLPIKHGYPLRVVAEDYYGDAWIKYVYKITVEKRQAPVIKVPGLSPLKGKG